jgi:hypothetical protein
MEKKETEMARKQQSQDHDHAHQARTVDDDEGQKRRIDTVDKKRIKGGQKVPFRRRIRIRDHVPYRNSTPQHAGHDPLLSHST